MNAAPGIKEEQRFDLCPSSGVHLHILDFWAPPPCLFPCLECVSAAALGMPGEGLEVPAPPQAEVQGGDSSFFLGVTRGESCLSGRFEQKWQQMHCVINHKNHYCAFRRGTEGRKTAGSRDKPKQSYGKAIFNSSPIPFPRCVTPRAELSIDLFFGFVLKKLKGTNPSISHHQKFKCWLLPLLFLTPE